eukprot:1007069-Prorocentrum_minimum.AAC.3
MEKGDQVMGQTVLSRWVLSPTLMKNSEVAESGSSHRACEMYTRDSKRAVGNEHACAMNIEATLPIARVTYHGDCTPLVLQLVLQR